MPPESAPVAVPAATPKPGLIKRLYDWCMAQAHTPRAVTVMNVVSFAESSFFPIPPDPLLIALCYANPKKWWRYAVWCTLSSVLGGMLGYYLGVQFEPFVRKLLPMLGVSDPDAKFAMVQAFYNKWGFLALSAKSLTPIPFKIFTIASGVLHYNFGLFVAGATLGRSIRFFLVAGLIRAFGERVRPFIEKQLALVVVIFFVVIVLGFVALNFLR
jgi:membrane protein YqaA with SNARE-associated domain